MSDHILPTWRPWLWGLWVLMLVTGLVYGVFALAVGLGVMETAKFRALPLAFKIHAITGGIVLLTGAWQFNPYLRRAWPGFHRVLGRIYVVCALMASSSAVTNAVFFDVGRAARLSFISLGLIWFAAIAWAVVMIRRRRFQPHRAWMIRGFALSLFFVSFSVFVPLMTHEGVRSDAAYAWAVTLSWGVNLILAELWLRLRR